MSSPNNSINESTTGICGFTGSSFVASPMTQYQLVVGSTTSSTLTQISAGTSGQHLMSNGTSSNPSFKSFSVNLQTFTTPGAFTYTPTSGMVYCIVELIGGGGGGGGCASTTAATVSVGAGGGSGGYIKNVYSAANIGASKSGVVGAGGTVAAGSNGGNGGATTFTVSGTASAGGGNGGLADGRNGGIAANGGDGGAISGQQTGITGAYGFPGIGLWNTVATANGHVVGGNGGSTGIYYSKGGRGAVVLGTATTTAGEAGINGGGGGGAGSVAVSGSNASGGAGGNGIVVITEYIWS